MTCSSEPVATRSAAANSASARDAELRGQAFGEPHGDAPRRGGDGFRNAGELRECPRELFRPAGRGDEIDSVHDLPSPPHASRDCGARDERRRRQRRRELLGPQSDRRVTVDPGVRTDHLDAPEDPLLGLRTEPFHLRDEARAARVLERREGVDPEALVKELRLSGAEPGDAETLAEPRREGGPQLLVVGQRARRDEGFDVREETASDSPDVQQIPGAHGFREVAREPAESPRARVVGAHLEDVLALELEHPRDLLERPGDFVAVHGRILGGQTRIEDE